MILVKSTPLFLTSFKSIWQRCHWLDAHREPLELVHAAARCQKFYSPLSDEFIFINAEQTKGPAPLLAVLLPGASKLRMAARMLCSRAMLQLGERNAEEAWHDLIACRRLGRLTSVGPTLVETGVGYSVENMGSRGMLTLLQQTHPSSVTVKQYRSGLKKLPPLRSIPDIVNVSERCTYIDALLTIASGQSDAMELLGMEPDVGKAAHMFRSVPIRAFDWNEALKKGNAHYDRMVSAMRLPTHALRRAAIAKLESDLQQRATLRNFDPRGKRGIETSQAFAAVIAAIMLPSAAKVREGEDVLRQTASNVEVAIALCEFRNDRDRYAEQLEQLVPKYLGKMPVDQFTGGKQRGGNNGDRHGLQSLFAINSPRHVLCLSPIRPFSVRLSILTTRGTK
ncbi:hypothetical protein N9D23_14135 [Rubripirellula sp.]|nr:hypothetical protein [Rubripirellula sp.]